MNIAGKSPEHRSRRRTSGMKQKKKENKMTEFFSYVSKSVLFFFAQFHLDSKLKAIKLSANVS